MRAISTLSGGLSLNLIRIKSQHYVGYQIESRLFRLKFTSHRLPAEN